MAEPISGRIKPSTTIRAKPDGLWTLVREFVDGPAVMTIATTTDATWSYADSAKARCGPDGDSAAVLSRMKCLLPSAPVGALIGKFGGSTADVAADKATMFVVGKFCVARVPDGGGPLFLTINDESGGMENNSGSVEVEVGEPRATVKPKPDPTPCCALIASLTKLASAAPDTAVANESNPADTP